MMRYAVVELIFISGRRENYRQNTLSTAFLELSQPLGMQMVPFALDQEFRHQIISLLSPYPTNLPS